MNTNEEFKKTVWNFYKRNKRSFPWRETTDPYKILVSELMLQQTQTERVIPKFNAFISTFPDVKSLANASLQDILKLWSGLGYNRRAMYLHKTVKAILKSGGLFPVAQSELIKLPGVGPYTAGAVRSFAFNKRSVVIETNIRRVYIHFFFPQKEKVADKDIIKIIEDTLPPYDYRNWYYALMDYGAHLAKVTLNPNRRSRHYTKQSKFEGSKRQLRGKIIKLFLVEGKLTENNMVFEDFDSDYVKEVYNELKMEGLVDPD